MSEHRKRQQEYDRIAASRISRLNGGIPKHMALGRKTSLSLRYKLKRLGLDGPHIAHALSIVDETNLIDVLDHQSLGVRFSTMPSASKAVKIWKVD